MRQDIFLKGVRITRESIEKELARLEAELRHLQDDCPHSNATKKYRSNSGNYDPSADSEWHEFDCPDCGKRWTKKLEKAK